MIEYVEKVIEVISRRISVWCKPLTSDLAFVAQTETCEADLGSLRSWCYVRGIAHEDIELVLLVNGSVCVTKDCEMPSRTQFNGIDVDVNSCSCRGNSEEMKSRSARAQIEGVCFDNEVIFKSPEPMTRVLSRGGVIEYRAHRYPYTTSQSTNPSNNAVHELAL